MIQVADRATPEPRPPEVGGWLKRLSPFLWAHKKNVALAIVVGAMAIAIALIVAAAIHG